MPSLQVSLTTWGGVGRGKAASWYNEPAEVNAYRY